MEATSMLFFWSEMAWKVSELCLIFGGLGRWQWLVRSVVTSCFFLFALYLWFNGNSRTKCSLNGYNSGGSLTDPYTWMVGAKVLLDVGMRFHPFITHRRPRKACMRCARPVICIVLGLYKARVYDACLSPQQIFLNKILWAFEKWELLSYSTTF